MHGELAELRAADLRLTGAEAEQLLRAMDLTLPLAALEATLSRTEGWMAGVKLVGMLLRQGALSLEQVATLRGDHRYLQEYFAQEVLQRQPPSVQAFLLATSPLERMSPALCDDVLASLTPFAHTIHPPAHAVLDYLERCNLFVVALDDAGCWYRYHPLFGDVLRQHLRQRHPGWERRIHQRASAWYEANGLPLEAVPHAVAADEPRRAVELLERSSAQAYRRGDLQPLREWAELLPDAARHSSIELCLAQAWSLVINGLPGALEPRLDELSQLIEAQCRPAPGPDGEHGQRYRSNVLLIRAMAANRRGDGSGALRHVREARAMLRAGEGSGVLELQEGTAHMLRGELGAAAKSYGQAVRVAQVAGSLLVALPTLGNLAMLEQRRGRLDRAEAAARQALGLADAHEGALPVAGCALIALGACYYARNELDAAQSQIKQGLELVRAWGSVLNQVHGLVELARVQLARGDGAAAAEALAVAEELTTRFEIGWSKEAADLPSLMVRVGWASGQLEAAMARAALLREPAEAAQGAPTYVRRAHDGAWCWSLLATGQQRQAATLMDGLCREYERSGWHGSLLELLPLSAVAHWSLGEQRIALDKLRRALGLAAESGHLRVFLDAGPALAPLLHRLAEQPGAPSFLAHVLAAAAACGPLPPGSLNAAAAPPAIPGDTTEPLRERELQILALISHGRSTQAIADTLCIGVGTVRWHIKNLYGKLDAHSRTQAVAHARQRGLLP
jgi:LuxR family maltose regulon positive regulatory protein